MPITSVEPRRLYRQIADQLRHLIDSGEFPVGTHLPTERQLADQLGVSRPTVREALIALEVDGRIRIRVGSGIYVLPPATTHQQAVDPIAGPFEILKARALIEGAIAEEVASIATAEDVKNLDELIAVMRLAKHPAPESIEVDRAFHIAIASILGNDAITAVVADLFDQRINPYFARLARHFENAASWQDALSEHIALRNAIAANDPEQARAAMQTHLTQSQARFSITFGDGLPVAQTPPLASTNNSADPKSRTRPSTKTAVPQSASNSRRKIS